MESPVEKQQSAPAGWYPDPSGSGKDKWWDGTGWAEEEWDARTENPPVTRLRPVLGPQVPVYTPFIWMFLALPIALILVDAMWEALFGIEAVTAGIYIPVSAIVYYAATVVLAYWDWRTLRSVGLVRPFHWAWAFLPLVYVIGRTVIVRQVAPNRGLLPVWLFIAAVVISRIIYTAA